MIQGSHCLGQRFSRSGTWVLVLILLLGSEFFIEDGHAENQTDGGYDIGLYVGTFFEVENLPINSMPMVACFVRHQLNNSWNGVLSLDSFVFNFEGPARLMGLETKEASEAFGKTSLITGALEYVFQQDRNPLQPYLQAGVGAGFTDIDVDEGVAGENGERFKIETDADDTLELVPMLAVGIRYFTESRWFFDFGARYNYHISHWEMTDRNTGRKIQIGHFHSLGAYAGFGVKL